MGLLLAGSLIRLAAPPAVWRWVLVGAMVLLVLREFGVLRFWLPQNKRLVPEHVHRHGRVFGPLQFGFEMGTSLRTYTPSALPHAAALMIALWAGPLAAVLAGVGFGLGRSAMTTGNLLYSDDNTWDLAFIEHERLIRALLVAGFAVSTAVALVF